MLLGDFIAQLPEARDGWRRWGASARRAVQGVTPDLRRVGPGMVFVALPSSGSRDVFEEACTALDRGAEAVVCPLPGLPVPRCVAMPDPRRALARAARAFLGESPGRVRPITVEGEALLRPAVAWFLGGLLDEAAVFSSVGCQLGARRLPAEWGNLDAFEFGRLVAAWERAGGRHAVVEATPEVALAGTLLESPLLRRVDANVRPGRIRVLRASRRGSILEIQLPGQTRRCTVSLLGGAQVEALDAAVEAALQLGGDPGRVLSRIPGLARPPGWLEAVEAGQPFPVLVEAAGTGPELAARLEALDGLVPGRLHLVVGARGGMSVDDRRGLGSAAAAAVRRLGGQLLVTTDDPGAADPARLMADVLEGAGWSGARGVADRGRAIETAVRAAGEADVVVVAGKGTRAGQRVGETILPWSDRAVVLQALAARGYPGDFE